MAESFDLRPISAGALPGAFERVERYRLLNQPEQAESICLDILEVEPGNQDALVALILSLTDQFGANAAPPGAAARARSFLPQLTDEYKRAYYDGIIRERQARVHLRRGSDKGSSYEAFREAMDSFEKAAAIRPPGDDDALLRWNACVRTIRRSGLQRRLSEGELPLE